MGYILSTPRERQLISDWLAYLVQHPGCRINWSPVLQGAQGIGKSVIAAIMARVLGRKNVMSVTGDIIFGDKYNAWAEGSQAVFVEEIRVKGEYRCAVMDKMKPLITNEYVAVRPIYERTREVRNVTNYFFITNADDAVAIDNNDRRYMIVESRMQRKEDKKEFAPGYFNALHGFLKEHPGAFLSMFKNHAISKEFSPTDDAPITAGTVAMVEASKTGLTIEVEDLLATGSNPLVTRKLCVVETIEKHMHERGIKCFSKREITSVLRSQGLENVRRGEAELRMKIGSERYMVYRDSALPRPTIEEIRETFFAYHPSARPLEVGAIKSKADPLS